MADESEKPMEKDLVKEQQGPVKKRGAELFQEFLQTANDHDGSAARRLAVGGTVYDRRPK